MADQASGGSSELTNESQEAIDSSDKVDEESSQSPTDDMTETKSAGEPEVNIEAGENAEISVTETDEGKHIEMPPGDDHGVRGIDDSLSIQEQLSQVKSYLDEEYGKLMSVHLKEYEDIGEFKDRVTEIVRVFKRSENYVLNLSECLSQVTMYMDEVRVGIDKKIKDDDLESWLSGRPSTDSTDKQQMSEDKMILAKAAESKAQLAQAKLDVAEARESVANATDISAQAAVAAEKAIQEAEEAAIRAEEARRVAEEKAREQEAARLKAEEKARKIAEEEARRQEEEEEKRKEDERLKGTPEGIARQKAEEERRREEEAQKNPANWPRFLYTCDAGDFDGGYKSIVRYYPDTFQDKEDLLCNKVDQIDQPVDIGEGEELVSNIIDLRPSSEDAEFKFTDAMTVAIPHCAPRNAGREAVIKYFSGKGKWMTMETKDVSFDDIKEAKFVEVRLKKFGFLAVVTRLKLERMTVSKKGGKFVSSVDSRIQMAVRPGVFRVNTDFTLQVQPIELAAVSDLKARQPDTCAPLMSSSPIIHLGMRNRKFVRPITVSVPIPPNQVKAKRPQTAHTGKSPTKSSTSSRPMSASGGGFGLGSFGDKSEDAQEDEIWLLTRSELGEWERYEKTELTQSKKGDLVTFDMPEPVDRYVILRTKDGTKAAQVDNIAKHLENSLSVKYTQMILRQKNDDLTDAAVVCSALNKVERTLRKFGEDGYEEGPMPSKDLEMKEGQEIEIRFRGNIQSDEEDLRLKFAYNTQLKSSLSMFVAEIDKFAQKSIDCYRGFAQFYTKGMVSVPVWSEEEKARAKKDKPTKFEMVVGDVLICEQLISLPKPEAEPTKPIERVPVTFKPDGPIDENLLQHIATYLGDEWKQVAHSLNIKRTRIQAILRNNVNSHTEDTVYDMLVTWAKRVPRSVDKVGILCDALTLCGRTDLVEDVRDKDDDFKSQRAQSAKDSYLRKAFLKVAQDKDAVNDWKELARRLSISDADVLDLENQNTNIRNTCYNMLLQWREKNPGEATISKLTTTLKRLRKNTLAEQIRKQCRS